MTGGASKTRGLTDLARSYLRLPANLGVPDMVESISGTSMSDPIYTSVVGTMLLIDKYGSEKPRTFRIQFHPQNIIQSLKNFFKKFTP